MPQTPNFALPLLHAAQAQKEIRHNEALMLVDGLLSGCVMATTSDPELIEPTAGQAWIVGSVPLGPWVAHEGDFAVWTEGGWRFTRAPEGMRVYDRESGTVRSFDGTHWQLPEAVPEPTGGATVDSEARATLSQLLAVLRSAGLIDAS